MRLIVKYLPAFPTIIAAALAPLCEVRAEDPQAAMVHDGPLHKICIRNYTKVPLSNEEADRIIERAEFLLKGAAEKHSQCKNVKILREGSVQPYNDEFPRTVVSSEDFRKITSDPCIKVVERIGWCGDTLNPIGSVLGCAPLPGRGLAVVRRLAGKPNEFNSGVEPVTWLHELGHTFGIPHNSALNLAVMSPYIGPTSAEISEGECENYAGMKRIAGASPSPSDLEAAQPTPAGGGANDGNATQPSETVEDFVKGKYPYMFPVEKAQSYEKDRKKVEDLLFDSQYSNYRSNIIALLGIIGDKNTIILLNKILESPLGPSPSETDIQDRFAAPLAIGTIAGRLKLPETEVSKLKSAANPDFWQQKLTDAAGAKSSSNDSSESNAIQLDDADKDQLSRDLAVQSIRGYALSGSQSAKENLEKGREGTRNAAIPESAKKEQEAIFNDALRLNSISQTKGPLSVFGFR